ncbi:MAG TPA: NADPH-dependent FMN reductase [Candidatus Binatia bacterium]|jgi:NAD(P)H-dependent FMN reductase
MRVLAISGSLKSDSTNAALLRAAAAMAPEQMAVEVIDRLIGELPHFRPDLDEDGMTPPAAVAEWRKLFATSDAVLISCPEYAHGVPGSFKNALDWLVSTCELTDKPVALLMASPSGAPHAYAALRPTLVVMGCDLVFEASLMFARRHLGDDGTLLDEQLAGEVRHALRALADAAERRRGS